MPHFSSSRFWFSALGIVVLIVGLAVAYDVRTQAFEEEEAAHYHIVNNEIFSSQAADSKSDADVLRKYGGNAALIVVGYKRRLRELFQGENLAYIVAIAAVVLAGVCFKIAWSDGGDEPG